MSRKKKKITKKNFISILCMLFVLIYSLYIEEINGTFGFTNQGTDTNSILKVYYMDVGQADAILIQNKEDNMLIDAGNNNDGELLIEYFDDLGIMNFKYVIGTHPHEDHIGGLDDIIKQYPIDTLYLPDAITTTTTFADVLDALEEKNMSYSVPEIGKTFTIGDAVCKIIYTGTDTSDLNNTSIILKIIFGKTSFLFTGDATSTTEAKILNQDIQADVLKVGHHGSKYSSTENFLDKVNPKYAIISVGKNNNYGHPENITLTKLKAKNIETLRTDELGTILLTSDGTSITVDHFSTNTNGG